MKITRISKLFGNIIAGKDMADVFKEGHVYSVDKIMDTIIIEDLGEYESEATRGWQFSDIMMDGRHLLTKEEYEHSKNK